MKSMLITITYQNTASNNCPNFRNEKGKKNKRKSFAIFFARFSLWSHMMPFFLHTTVGRFIEIYTRFSEQGQEQKHIVVTNFVYVVREIFTIESGFCFSSMCLAIGL